MQHTRNLHGKFQSVGGMYKWQDYKSKRQRMSARNLRKVDEVMQTLSAITLVTVILALIALA